ncbi:MAG: NirA family protein [Verrucomicrobiae bacterium]|nr:NirA family protein [Verrucomicrobiae bacterium]
MSTALPFQEIAGQALNDEQTAYLQGLFSGLANRGLKFTDVQADPTGPRPATDEDLIFEERVKRDLHPLDAFDSFLEDAADNRAPAKENVFRYKWNGLFFLAPSSDAYMCRLRIPGGLVKSFQLRELAKISRDLTTGYIQITTRANFQLRNIEPHNAPALLSRIQSIGLSSRGAGADNIRNITCSPTAGIDPHELIDTLPLAQELGQYIIHHREFYDLPRKFNIAFDGGGLISSVEDTNDIGLRAVKIADGTEKIPAGVYFRVALGGATGHKSFAEDAGVLVKPGEIIKVTAALVRVFIANGNRTNRKKARLKHLLETWTLEQYIAEAEKLLGYELLKAPLDQQGQFSLEAKTLRTEVPHSHEGVFPQKQSGFNYVGVGIPVGQITPKQMNRVAELADLYGSGEVRLTVWQNLIIPNIPDTYVGTVRKALTKAGLFAEQSNIRSGFIACTGNSYCKFASSNTKGHALEFIKHLEKRVRLDQPINVHITGCPHSCAQHYMGDIGLLATKVKVQGESVEGYHVFIGGGFGRNRKVGRQVFTGLTSEQVKTTLETMFNIYLKRRIENESFQSFTNRHDLDALQGMFSNDE